MSALWGIASNDMKFLNSKNILWTGWPFLQVNFIGLRMKFSGVVGPKFN